MSSLRIIHSQRFYQKRCCQPIEDDTFEYVDFLFENANVAYHKILFLFFREFLNKLVPPKRYSVGRNNLASDLLASFLQSCNASSSLRVWIFKGLVALPSDSVANVWTDESASFLFGPGGTGYWCMCFLH